MPPFFSSSSVFIYRVLKMGQRSGPVPYPDGLGQQKSLSWIKTDNINSPFTAGGVVKRLRSKSSSSAPC